MLSVCVYVCVYVQLLSSVRLCDTLDTLQAPVSMGFGGQEYWNVYKILAIFPVLHHISLYLFYP